MHGLLVLRADALAGCTEASEQEAELTSRAFSKPMKRSGGLSPIPTPTAEAGWSASEREWQQYGKDTNDISLLEAFKEKHKADPVYVRLAETRIAELKKQQVAIAAPPAPPTQQSNITISVATQLRAEPGSRVRLPIEIRPNESVPKSSFVRIFGLPHAAALSEGHAIVPGIWAVPLTALPTLTIILPSGVQGQSDVAVSLINSGWRPARGCGDEAGHREAGGTCPAEEGRQQAGQSTREEGGDEQEWDLHLANWGWDGAMHGSSW